MERQGEEVQPGQSLTPLLLLQLWSPEEKGGGEKKHYTMCMEKGNYNYKVVE